MKEFISVFQLSKTKLFFVRYYTLSTNRFAHFATSAAEFCKSKCDYSRCGQAQNDILDGYKPAMDFYKKWDAFHLMPLSDEQYSEMRADLERLQSAYNFLLEELDETKRPYSPDFSFRELSEWSKMKPKKTA